MKEIAIKAEHKHHKQFRRPLLEILEDLRQPIPTRLSKHKVIKGKKIEFVSWYTLVRLMDYYAPGWDFVVETAYDGRKVAVIGKLTIKAEEGDFVRSATGNENSELESYGDPYSNAEAMCWRRCCSKFGLGLHLWEV